jgi:hypothetical protein
MHVSNQKKQRKKERRKKLFKVALQEKENIFPKTIWKIVLVRLLHITLTQSKGVLESKIREY